MELCICNHQIQQFRIFSKKTEYYKVTENANISPTGRSQVMIDLRFNSEKHMVFLNTLNRLWLIYSGWLAFLLFNTVHCNFIRWNESGIPFNFFSSCGYIALNWGIWLIATPFLLCFLTFSQIKKTRWFSRIIILFALTMLAIAARVTYDIWIGSGEWKSSIAYFSPGYLKAMIAILAIWQIFYRPPNRNEPLTDTNNITSLPINKLNSNREIPEAIWIDKGTSRTRVKVASIIAVKSAGNYLEVVTRFETVLTRNSLNIFLDDLGDIDLVRIHRSIAVRKSEIKEVKFLKAGNGIVHMGSKFSFPVSKSYLKSFKD